MTMKTSLRRTFRGMMARRPPRSALLDLTWMVLGLFFVLLDLFLDLWVTYSLLIERKYLLARLYICFIIISSSTQQLFSFCWVLDDKKGSPVPWYILVIHLLHLGLLWRYVQYLKLRWTVGIEDTPTVATIFSLSINPKYQSSLEQADDIGLLRVFDTFLEHTPQLVLLLANSNCTIKLSYGLGMAISFFSISWMLLNHKRTMCKSQGNESKFQSFGCCITYLLFNLLLVTPRVLSIALYVSSVNYSFIILHLAIELIVMLIICYFARTNFMTSRILEWIYRLVISVCLIYTWFNIVKGPTKRNRIIYHCFIIIDTSIMLVLAWWYWKREPCSHGGFVVIASVVAASYMLGLVITCLYYKWMMYRSNRYERYEVDSVPTSSHSTAAVHQPYRRLQLNTSNPTMREEFF